MDIKKPNDFDKMYAEFKELCASGADKKTIIEKAKLVNAEWHLRLAEMIK